MKNSIYIELSREGEKVMRESIRIPHSLTKIHISVIRPEDFPGAGFLAVFDEKQRLRLQKMIAYGEQELGIGENPCDNSAGSVAGTIGAGDWTIVYGTLFSEWESYDGKLPVTIEIVISDEDKAVAEPLEHLWLTGEDDFHINEKLFSWGAVKNTKTAWFKGDFHTHTRLSDGKEPLENAMKKAVDMQLDFYVPTEHNLVHTGWCNTGILVVPGVEVTLPMGHYNLFGITERPKQLDTVMLVQDKKEMAEQMLSIIEDANRRNWIVSINHPFLHIWQWHLEEVPLCQVQCLEIINDPTYPYAKEANDKAISFLDAVWMAGYKIYGVGGSDAHNLIEERYEGAEEPSIAGDPATWVYCECLSAENLLSAVKSGHMVVTRHCHITPHIYGDKQTYLPGDEVTERQITFEIEISGTKDYPRVWLVSNTGAEEIVKAPLQVIKKENGTFLAKKKIKIEQAAWKWFRIEVRDWEGNFLGYINPVYSGKTEPRYRTFGEVKEAWIQGECRND